MGNFISVYEHQNQLDASSETGEVEQRERRKRIREAFSRTAIGNL